MAKMPNDHMSVRSVKKRPPDSSSLALSSFSTSCAPASIAADSRSWPAFGCVASTMPTWSNRNITLLPNCASLNSIRMSGAVRLRFSVRHSMTTGTLHGPMPS